MILDSLLHGPWGGPVALAVAVAVPLATLAGVTTQHQDHHQPASAPLRSLSAATAQRLTPASGNAQTLPRQPVPSLGSFTPRPGGGSRHSERSSTSPAGSVGTPSPTPRPTLPPTPAPTVAPPPAASCPSSGFFLPGGNAAGVVQLASTLGVPAQILTIYAGAPNWTSFGPGYIPTTTMQLSLAVGNITPSQATQYGKDLVAAGHANTIIRIMWEMNGNWYPWGVQAWSSATYITAYRSIQQGFAATPGNHFTYVWNLNAGSDGANEFNTYPGDAYVSNVGIDWYDLNGGGGAPASTIPPILSFAEAHGKPVSLDEWGVDGVADASAYIQYVANIVHDPADHVSFQAYFEYGTSTITEYPADVAAYKTYFDQAC